MLSPNIIIPYNSTHASIPSGWSRDTRFDDRNVKTGSSFSQGGSSVHTHTSDAHTHSLDNHSHTLSYANDAHGASIQHKDNPSEDMIGAHYQNAVTSAGMSSANQDSSASITWSSASNIPASRSVIFIKSTGYNLLPVNAVVLRQDKSRSIPYFTNAVGKYLRGAGTGANAGTNSGANSHQHDVSHGHTGASHTHSNTTSGSAVEVAGRIGGWHSDSPSLSSIGHQHTTSINASSHNPSNYSNTTAGSGDTISLKYKEFYAFVNDQVNGIPQVGDLAIWTENTSPPIGWSIVSISNDFYIKIASESAESLSSSGSLTHTHSSISHTHTSSAHTHTAQTGGQLSGHVWGNTTGSYNNTSTSDHGHEVTVASASPARTNGTITCSTDSNEPLFATVKIIKLDFLPIAGSIINSFIG